MPLPINKVNEAQTWIINTLRVLPQEGAFEEKRMEIIPCVFLCIGAFVEDNHPSSKKMRYVELEIWEIEKKAQMFLFSGTNNKLLDQVKDLNFFGSRLNAKIAELKNDLLSPI